jgi:hypothetical protein
VHPLEVSADPDALAAGIADFFAWGGKVFRGFVAGGMNPAGGV